MAALVLMALLPGCERVAQFYDTRLPLDTPMDWWHELQGGQIAEQRPPPPGVTDPFPNFGQVPARPTPTDAATRRALSARLAAERDRTERDGVRNPIVPPQAAPAPVPAAVRTPPADPGASTAVLDTASATPAPQAAAPPSPAQAAPAAPAPAPPAIKQAAAPATPAAPRASHAAPAPAPAASETMVSGPLPELPGAAPPVPILSGIPAATTAPATPRPLPSVSVVFPPGAAALPMSAQAALQALAARRAGGPVQITAGGDAGSGLPEAQAAALPLALRRARAMAEVLTAAGVPAAALRTQAAATGRGGTARLVE